MNEFGVEYAKKLVNLIKDSVFERYTMFRLASMNIKYTSPKNNMYKIYLGEFCEVL